MVKEVAPLPPEILPDDQVEAPGRPTADEHTDARMKAQMAKMQEAFAENLVEAFHLMIVGSAQTEESSLATLTVVQMEELLDCLYEVLTTPPPEGGQPFVPAPDTEEPA